MEGKPLYIWAECERARDACGRRGDRADDCYTMYMQDFDTQMRFMIDK